MTGFDFAFPQKRPRGLSELLNNYLSLWPKWDRYPNSVEQAILDLTLPLIEGGGDAEVRLSAIDSLIARVDHRIPTHLELARIYKDASEPERQLIQSRFRKSLKSRNCLVKYDALDSIFALLELDDEFTEEVLYKAINLIGKSRDDEILDQVFSSLYNRATRTHLSQKHRAKIVRQFTIANLDPRKFSEATHLLHFIAQVDTCLSHSVNLIFSKFGIPTWEHGITTIPPYLASALGETLNDVFSRVACHLVDADELVALVATLKIRPELWRQFIFYLLSQTNQITLGEENQTGLCSEASVEDFFSTLPHLALDEICIQPRNEKKFHRIETNLSILVTRCLTAIALNADMETCKHILFILRKVRRPIKHRSELHLLDALNDAIELLRASLRPSTLMEIQPKS